MCVCVCVCVRTFGESKYFSRILTAVRFIDCVLIHHNYLCHQLNTGENNYDIRKLEYNLINSLYRIAF